MGAIKLNNAVMKLMEGSKKLMEIHKKMIKEYENYKELIPNIPEELNTHLVSMA